MRATSALPRAALNPSTAAFRPLAALQSLLAADHVALQQRLHAAQQLERYFARLEPTRALVRSYEPYLPLLLELLGTGGTPNGRELQTRVLAMLLALSRHDPCGVGDWMATNTSVGNPQWLVQWSYELVRQTGDDSTCARDSSVAAAIGAPVRPEASTGRGQELDRLCARVLHMWRTLLDHTDDAALVALLVQCLLALLTTEETAAATDGDWQLFVLKKLQTHFVDIADVLIGWMMSVGPQRQLREEILSLLHSFGRLWADNSVFSLQLLTSFADEIANLCESWNDYQEDDSDRLSTLLVSFVMVAQCVPNLALAAAAAGADSCFERVMHCVALCPQPKYSLFCLANCSVYLVAMSDCKHSNFSTLSVTVVRFLLYQCAVQSQMHDSEVDKLLWVVENTCKLASANFCNIQNPLLLQPTAIGALRDEMPGKSVKKSGKHKHETTMECLFYLNAASGATYITHLCLQLVQLGGIGALKVLGAQALQNLSGRQYQDCPSYFAFAATCFILVSREPKNVIYSRSNDDADITAILEVLLTMLEKYGNRQYQPRLVSRQLCLVLEMASTFICAVSSWNAGRSDAAEIHKEITHRMLECAASLLSSRAIVVRDCRLNTDLLKLIDAIVSETVLAPVVSQQVYRKLVKTVSIAMRCSSVKVRQKCLQVFKTLACRAEARPLACSMIEVALDLALDPRQGESDETLASGLCDVARWALLYQEKVHGPRHPPQDVGATFVAADFEAIMDLFHVPDCDEDDWNRVCRRIGDRSAPNKTLSNTDVLVGAVQQAAGWCVQNRLRTHFGGPAQSFERLDRLLQKCLSQVHDVPGRTSRDKNAWMLTSGLMLEFVAALEMHIARAICSTEVDQRNSESDDHRPARFFRANKMVCDDWLSRIRPCLVEMSKYSTSYELFRYHSHNLVTTCYIQVSRAMTSRTSDGVSEEACNELQQAEKDMDAALFSLCRCHVDAKDADSIVGFQRWGDSVSAALNSWYQSNESMDIENDYLTLPRFRWLNAMRYEAEMRYEDAITEYELLLQPVLTANSSCALRCISAAQVFECPMKYLRLSPRTLLGCFMQCAKCYTYLRAWTKLRAFATQFIDVVHALAGNAHVIEEIQAICACSETWSDEIETIRGLERETTVPAAYSDSGCEITNDRKQRAALALRVWSVFSDPVSGSLALQLDTTGQLRSRLMSLALQPSPWNGYAGDITGKRVEETLLRMTGMLKGSRSADMQLARICTEDCKLNPNMHDSVLWTQPLYTLSWDGLSYDGSVESADSHCLHLLSVARLARKQHNFVFAQGLLNEAVVVIGASRMSVVAVSYEKARILENIGMKDQGRQLLETECESSLTSLGLKRRSCMQDSATTRSLLHLATSYAHAESTDLLSPRISSFLESTLASIVDLGDQELVHDRKDIDVLPGLRDAAVHTCLVAATAVSPKSAKAWLRYSDWCYERGKQVIARIANQNGYIQLEPSDKAKVNVILDEMGVAQPDRDLIICTFCHLLEDGKLINQRQDILQQLCANKAPPNHKSDAIRRLVQLQRNCHSKNFRLLSMAALGYDKYLTVLLGSSDSDFSRQTTVALRLLSLLTTYGVESDVVSALEEAFSKGPVQPWSRVVPQLIARAYHPAAAVSSLVCLVLKRLAQHAPHIVVYPTVMDTMDSSLAFEKERDVANSSFAAVRSALQNVARRQVEGVRLLVSELRRISVLWDEAWISTLMKLAADVSRQTCTLEKEAARLDKTSSLSAREKNKLVQRKLVAFVKVLLENIERVWKETCGSATDEQNVSPHEHAFLKEYGGSIKAAMERLQDRCSREVWSGSPKTLQEFWQPFAGVLKALMNGVGRRDQLPLHDISPALASASRELVHVHMPGASSGQGNPITIYRISPFVTILRSKTKPKSLEFVGSDGKTHKYLLKAREDLRLDERIMQFLRVTNDFLRADDDAAARDLLARNYSVIPLSRNAGLIQMVPDVVPLFQVYASRTENQSIDGQTSQDHGTAPSAQLQQPPPPTAQFYAKLKRHGITNVSPSNRARWPTPVLKQVYQELVAQRPRNVLSHELLFRSKDLRESWAKSARFSRSLAVMSILGYIVGLGDRHLDNILLCIDSGDIVHIDHNVCFERGRRLKVPEIVPFRLTPMLQDALGLTGIEGKFRVAFETTLRVVRSDDVRETLLMLFEAFVYSPLVDWISDDKRQGQSGDLKTRLDANVNLALFRSRAEERRQDTISFGRQYEQLAVAITDALVEKTKLPFVRLLIYRKQLLCLEKEEQVSMKESLMKESDLSTCRVAQNAEHAEMEAATAQVKSMTAAITLFADDCLAKHRQIEAWKQKSLSFVDSDPEVRLSAVVQGSESASFQEACATLCGMSARSSSCDEEERRLAALESTCHSLDSDVTRLRYEIEKIASCLIPHLCAYSQWRKELDAYLCSEYNVSVKDVYFEWWARCTECLRELANGTFVPRAEEAVGIATVNDPGVVSQESIDNSRSILRRLNHDDLRHPSSGGKIEENSAFASQVDQLLQDVWDALSATERSSGQGPCLMELAGASWIVEAMEKVGSCSGHGLPEAGAFTPALVFPSNFGQMVAVSCACTTLLELVLMSKDSKERLRGDKLLGDIRDKGSRLNNQGVGQHVLRFLDALQAVGSLAIVLQEELISNIHGRKWDDHAYQDLSKCIDGTSGGMQRILDTALVSAENSGIQNVFAAVTTITQKVTALVDSLQQESVVTSEEAERIRRLSSSSWINLVCDVIKLSSADKLEQDIKQEACALWSDRMDTIVSNCLTGLFRYVLFSVISRDLKIDFCALAQEPDAAASKTEQTSVRSRWRAFFDSQVPASLPSASSKESVISRASVIVKSVSDVMTVCENHWAQQWRINRSDLWQQKMSALRTQHATRLRYATWLATQPVAPAVAAQAPGLRRVQLLTLLSSQGAQLSALLADHAVLEANVLETTQQMEHIALTLGSAFLDDRSSSNGRLHDCVQTCYSSAVALFEYGRALLDLVEGITMVETSSGEVSRNEAKLELEVDRAGKDLLRKASEATMSLHSRVEAVSEVDARVRALQDEMACIQNTHNIITSDKRAAAAEFLHLCSASEDAVVEMSRVLHKHVQDMRYLLNNTDKLKATSTEVASVASESLRSQVQLQIQKDNPLPTDCSSPASTTAYSFLENDRLAKQLRRSVRSANHVQMLEGVLQRHEEACVEFRQTIGPIDQALTVFDTQADHLLAFQGHPDAKALLLLILDLVETLRVFSADTRSTLDTSDEAATSLLVAGRDVVRRCVKLFFEATEVACRLLGAEEQSRRPSIGVPMQHVPGEDEEEQRADADGSADAITNESGSSIVSGASSDCGGSHYDHSIAGPSYVVEEKSRHGLQVVKRIEEKLSGKVTEVAHAPSMLTVEQQASWLIDEATKIDNLCVMYEGWTPWI